jgi:hypothetical protein
MVLLAAAAWSLATGCAFFQDLSSDPYRPLDAGVNNAQCTGDGGCPSLTLACSHPECTSAQVCCLTLNLLSGAGGACVSPSECSGSFSFALCSPQGGCPDGGSCLAQTCTVSGASLPIYACQKLPSPPCSMIP